MNNLLSKIAHAETVGARLLNECGESNHFVEGRQMAIASLKSGTVNAGNIDSVIRELKAMIDKIKGNDPLARNVLNRRRGELSLLEWICVDRIR